jgi:uncharacterized protein DUF4124
MAVTRPIARWLLSGVMLCVLTGWSAPIFGQTFYKWTDDKGVVHFSDSPPSRVPNVEERTLHVPPVVAKPGDAADDAAAATGDQAKATDAASGAPTGESKSVPQGPAKIVIVSAKKPRTGPSSMHITGEVKNVGGKDAQHVAVNVVAVDMTQGTQCLEQEAEVAPATLQPGGTGNFDVDIDNPCLFGEANVDVKPLWE